MANYIPVTPVIVKIKQRHNFIFNLDQAETYDKLKL